MWFNNSDADTCILELDNEICGWIVGVGLLTVGVRAYTKARKEARIIYVVMD